MHSIVETQKDNGMNHKMLQSVFLLTHKWRMNVPVIELIIGSNNG